MIIVGEFCDTQPDSNNLNVFSFNGSNSQSDSKSLLNPMLSNAEYDDEDTDH